MTIDEFNVMAKKAYEIRGMVINETIYLEKALEYFIATNYCGDTKARDRMVEELLTNDVGFRAKVNAFLRIIKDKHKVWLSQNSEIPKNLEKIATDRNIMAHEVLDTSLFGIQQYELNKNINFAKFDKIERNTYGEGYLEEMKIVIGTTYNKISLLLPGFKEMPFPYG